MSTGEMGIGAAAYQALLRLVDLLPLCGDRPSLLKAFVSALAPVLPFDECMLAVPLRPEGFGEVWAARVLRTEAKGESAAGESGAEILADITSPPPLHRAIAQEVGAVEDIVILDERPASPHFENLQALLRDRGLATALLMPLGTPAGIGLLVLASTRAGALAHVDRAFLTRVAWLVASAVGQEELRRQVEAQQLQARADREHWRTLLEVNNALVAKLDLEAVRTAIAPSMHRIVAHEYLNLLLLDPDAERIGLFSLDPGVPEGMSQLLASIRVDDTPFAGSRGLDRPLVCAPEQMTYLPEVIRKNDNFQSMRRFGVLPLVTPRRTLGAIVLSSRSEHAFEGEALAHAAEAAAQIAIAIENALAFEEIAALKDRLTLENLYLEDEIRGWNEFEEIVGESKALERVLGQVRSVADTDTTVLLLGETGTGKELFARAIHNLSARKARTLVAVNCAASPAGLLESEWFGYEKGAFTGALARKAGRFELADKGTLFLDEVGDIPLDLQAKLLRVLQEREIERLGGMRPLRVDFRLIAATNADLQSMVNDKRFRSDLFYRLSVFPIRIPPLRERRDDIPPLVNCFVRRYAKRLRRRIDSVPRETMASLCEWPWPGNVRELQNVIERAVILSPGPTLQVPASEFTAPAAVAGTLESAERAHILRALKDTNWVVGGPDGAAARLGVKRTTLISTMKRLGIGRPSPSSD